MSQIDGNERTAVSPRSAAYLNAIRSVVFGLLIAVVAVGSYKFGELAAAEKAAWASLNESASPVVRAQQDIRKQLTALQRHQRAILTALQRLDTTAPQPARQAPASRPAPASCR